MKQWKQTINKNSIWDSNMHIIYQNRHNFTVLSIKLTNNTRFSGLNKVDKA